VTNVVFGELAASTLRQALHNSNEPGEILTFPDDLSFGPINPADGLPRERWINDNFHLLPEQWEIFPINMAPFFHSISSPESKIMCWVCNNSIYEYCGFGEIIRQIGGENLYFISTMDLDVSAFKQADTPKEEIPLRLAHMSPLIASHLVGREVLVSASLRAVRGATWQRIRNENAPLRTIGLQGVESVSISYFDSILLAHLGSDWRPMRSVVTYAAIAANPNDYFRVDMIVLAGRLNALIREGRIETAGSATDYMSVNVRLR